jgi:hypothetical protein
MVKILEYMYPTNKQNANVRDIECRISEFDSFEEYLNLQAVNRTNFPEYYRLGTRTYDLQKQECLSTISWHYDYDDWSKYKWCNIFAKVIE